MPRRSTPILCALLAALGLARGAAAQTTFQTGDLYVIESKGGAARIHNITGGGDFSAASPFATLTGTGAIFGEICFSAELEVMYVADFSANVIHAITPAGATSTFATGLASPVAVECLRDGRIFAQEFGSSAGSVVEVTAGGDFALAPAFVSSTAELRGLAQLRSGALLVASWEVGKVRVGTTGGAFATLPLVADLSGTGDGVVQSINEGPAGEILVAQGYDGGPIYDVRTGSPVLFAFGRAFLNTATDVVTGEVYAIDRDSCEVFAITGGGDFSAALSFAYGLGETCDPPNDPGVDTALAAVPWPATIFRDDFDLGDVCAWSDSVGDADDCTPAP